jgi:DNA-binding transcriptional MocR family regulator
MTRDYDPLATVQAAGPPGTISFVYGLPDPATFPAEELGLALEKVLKEKPSLALQYAPEQGYGPLIDFLAARIQKTEGLAVGRPQIMLTGGVAQALDHVCTMLTRRGEIVLVEAPTYHESLKTFRNHGLEPRQVPIDQDGLDVEVLSALLEKLKDGRRRIAFIYLIPSFQNPSGVTLSLDRRKAVLDICARNNLLLVEDDVYSDLVYEGERIPSLAALDRNGRVLHLGSFSKLIAPGLRLGWMVAPPEHIGLFVRSGLRAMGGGANPLIANTLAVFCEKGLLEPHVESLRVHYREKRDVMARSLRETMPPGVSWANPRGGFFIWLRLPAPLQADDLLKISKAAKVTFFAGNAFFAESPVGQFIRLSFSFVPRGRVEEGVAKIASLIRSSLAPRPSN